MVQQNAFFSLEQVIDRQPLIVTPHTLLSDVVGSMHEWGNNFTGNGENTPEVDTTHRTSSSCALVWENSQLQGIFTERDLVKLVAAGKSMAGVTVGEVMSREMVTLTFTGTEDVFLALGLLRSHSIRHLPILKEDGRLLGLVTAKDIRQKLQPVNLMKWRKVREVMRPKVVRASPDDTVRHLARLMANHRVSCVAICETQLDPATNNSLVHPVGIITERDLIQYQNLNLDLEQPVRNLMSAPLFLISPEDSLWSIHQQMQQRRVRRLLVGGAQGELVGIVTQTSLLEVLNPSEMYGVVEMLQRQVCQLETEREAFLHSRNRELEQEVKERTSVIATANQQLQREIERRKRNEAELKQTHQQLSFHVENSPLAVVEWDNDFRVKHWSKRAEEIFGWQESEVLGKHWRDWQFVFAEDLDRLTIIADRLRKGNEPRNVCHNRNYTKNGSVIHCEWHNSVLLNESGNLISILSLAQDISDRTLARSQLRNRVRQQQAVAELGQFALSADLDSILDLAVNLVADTLEVEYCKVLELLPDGENLLLKAGKGWHEGLVGVTTIRADTNGQCSYTFLNSEPVVVTDLDSETRFQASDLLLDHQVVSGMSVVISGNSRAFGTLGTHTTRHRVFTQDDLNFLCAIANIIAQANEGQQSKAELEQQLEFERLIANISARFLTVSTEQLSTEITSALQTISEFVQVETSYIFRFSEDRSTFSMTHEWSIPEAVPQIQNAQDLRVTLFPWAIAKIERGETIYVNSVAELPSEAATDRESWQTFNLKSLLIIPYRESARIVGWLGFASFSQQIIWSPSKINLLQVIGEIFASTLQRQQTSLALQVSEQRLDNILTSLEDVVWSVDPQTFEMIYMNQAAEKVYGHSCAEFYANSNLWLEVVHPEDRERVSHFSQCLLEEGSKNIEYRIVRPNGEIRWLLDRAQIIYNELGTPIRLDGIASDITERKQAEAALRDSEQRFRNLADHAPMMVWVTDETAYCTYVSQSWCEFTGQTKETGLGFGWMDAIHPDDRAAAQTIFLRANERQEAFQLDYRVRRYDGEYRWAIDAATPWIGNNGQFKGYIGSVIDISDRKEREEELRRQALIFNSLYDAVILTDLEGRIIDWNPSSERMFGYKKSEVLGRTPSILHKPEESATLTDRVLKSLMNKGNWTGEINFIRKDGTEGVCDTIVVPLYDRENNLVSTIGINRDISDRKRQEKDLCISEVSHRTLAENLPAIAYRVFPQESNRMIFFNDMVQRMTGYSQEELTTSKVCSLDALILPSDRPKVIQTVKKALAKQQSFEVEYRIKDKQGNIRHFWEKGKVTQAEGQAPQIDGVIFDMTDRQLAEEKIREQAALLDVATDAIMVRGLDDKILFWNQGAENLYGWTATEVLAVNVNEPLYRQSTARLKEIQQTVLERGEWQGELNHVTKAGSEIIVKSRWTLVKDEAGNPRSYLVVNADITEQKQLEAQFLRTQRLESLGTLAGGIAHDLNNILAPILGFSKLLPLKLPDVDEQTKGFFKIMENNANRGTALVKQILTFSRGMEGDRGIVQIRHLITEIQQIITETFPKSIELEVSVPKNLWTVNADVNQLHQVLMNLSVNARDAMPNGGKLKITAENFPIDESFARLHLDAHEGSYLLITVSDTGIGIAPEIIDRIFEPFFTTKELGRGTGLGLSTVIGIIRSHGGFVDVVSSKEPKNHGTQFKIFLPALDTTTTEEEEIAEIPQGNGELILVVDDETAILEVTKATLETYNYRVLTASDGIDAIALYAQNQQDIKAVIMDIMMPSMDGKTTIRTLKKINPEVKIIAVSGLINRHEIVSEVDSDIAAFMNKPHANDDLLYKIAEIIRRES